MDRNNTPMMQWDTTGQQQRLKKEIDANHAFIFLCVIAGLAHAWAFIDSLNPVHVPWLTVSFVFGVAWTWAARHYIKKTRRLQAQLSAARRIGS